MVICPVSLLYGNICSSVRTCPSCPFPPKDVPSLRISTTRLAGPGNTATPRATTAPKTPFGYQDFPAIREVPGPPWNTSSHILWPLDHGTHPLHLDKHDGYRGEYHQIAGYAAGAGISTHHPAARRGQCFRCCFLRWPPPLVIPAHPRSHHTFPYTFIITFRVFPYPGTGPRTPQFLLTRRCPDVWMV